jgi:hypothetical protein
MPYNFNTRGKLHNTISTNLNKSTTKFSFLDTGLDIYNNLPYELRIFQIILKLKLTEWLLQKPVDHSPK